MIRLAILAPVLLGLLTGRADAFEQPPIQSPQDKACRDEAAGRVFETPDPQGLGVYAIGKQIYFACMQRAEAAPAASGATAKVARRLRPTG